MLVLLNGSIAGISGVLGGRFRPARGGVASRLAFLLRLIGAPFVWLVFAPPAKAAYRRRLRGARRGGPAGRHRHTLRLGLHQRPWRVRHLATVAALAGGHGRLHGRPASSPRSSSAICSPPEELRMLTVASFLSGLAFGLGLIVSNMANPANGRSQSSGVRARHGHWDGRVRGSPAARHNAGLSQFTTGRPARHTREIP